MLESTSIEIVTRAIQPWSHSPLPKKYSLRSRIVRFGESVRAGPDSLEYFEDGVLQVDNGHITLVDDARKLQQQGFDLDQCEHRPDSLLIAGFIDAHVHASQLQIVGSHGKQLLQWLDHYTFPAELQFADETWSYTQNQQFVDALLANGTTSVMAFTTRFRHSTDHLFSIAAACKMRLLAGNVLMDRNAPPSLLQNSDAADQDCRALIRRWHGHGRLEYAITPRFSATSTVEQLHQAGQLARDYPDIRIQTHLSENQAEVAWMKRLFPAAEDYLHIYELFGLHTANTVFAHCLHLSANELSRIAVQGSSIAFCPSSNLFLGSGLFDLARVKAHDIPVALATDVGAGTSLSQFRNMGDAYKVCQLKGYPLSAAEAFYMTTLGAARALGLDQYIGNLTAGREADFIEINASAHPVVRARLTTATTIEEELFVYMTCGDERLIASTTIAGDVRYSNPTLF